MLKKILTLCVFVALGHAASLPYITKCKLADSACLLKSAQAAVPIFAKGIPELGVETLEPFKIKNTIDASTGGLQLKLKDLIVTRLSGCIARKVERSPEKMHAIIVCSPDVNGHYEMDGQLLILPVKGNGKIEVKLRKLVIDVNAEMGEKTKNGKKYWDIKRVAHTFKLEDKSQIHFENLLTGSDVLGRAANDVIENSSNDIILEVGPPVVKAIVVGISSNIRRFFNNVLPEDLTLDV